LTRQLSYYRDYQMKVVNMAGQARANDIFSGAIHLLSAGSSDFIQNYYINPVLRGLYSVDRFSDLLMSSYSSFIQVSIPPQNRFFVSKQVFEKSKKKKKTERRKHIDFGQNLMSTSLKFIKSINKSLYKINLSISKGKHRK
jgi:hypothetical protein